jgi:alpha-tubulin suppressor-like RCC1 family protein
MKKKLPLLFPLLLSFFFSVKNSFAQSIASLGGNGIAHSLFICSDSTAQACGKNGYGELNDGTTVDRANAVPVNSLTQLIAVAGGGGHSLFLKNNGRVYACGFNDCGQLGNGTITSTFTGPAVLISSLTNVVSIAGGWRHSLFVKSDGTVWASGSNDFGQLGDGTSTDRSTPVQITSLSGVVAAAGGFRFSLFLKSDGTVWGCGDNIAGQLGNGTITLSNTPVQIGSLTNITAIAAGGYHSIFLKNTGAVWACGNNGNGELGDGTTTTRYSPIVIPSLAGITAISSGGAFHSLFLKNDGTVKACGRNDVGQLGDGTTINRSTPVTIPTLSGIEEISAGGDHSLFLKNNGTVWACGFNQDGNLGNGTNTFQISPVQVNPLCAIAAGINEITEPNLISIFPNPSRGIFSIKHETAMIADIAIYDVLGKMIFNSKENGSELKVDLLSAPAGIYLVRISDSGRHVIHKKLIIE